MGLYEEKPFPRDEPRGRILSPANAPIDARVKRKGVAPMASRTVRVTLPDGRTLDVPVSDSNDKWADVRLDDGTSVRVKTVVSRRTFSSAARVDRRPYNPDGNPAYSSLAVAILLRIFSFLRLMLRRPKADPQSAPNLTRKG